MSPILQSLANASAFGFRSAGAPPGDFDSIATTVVGSGGSSTITFNSITSAFTHLQLRAMFLGSPTSGVDVIMRFNSDTGSNYNWHRLYGNGSTAAAQGSNSTTAMYVGADAARDTYPAVAVIDILDYKNTNKNKTIFNLSGFEQNGAGTTALWSGLWRSTAVINSITISIASGNFAQYSSFALYGIKVAS